MTQKAYFLEQGLGSDLSKDACSQADHVGLWMLERVLEHSEAAD